jgi:RHS repeat-associated protein
VTTVYVGGVWEKNLSTSIVTKYYHFNGKRIAFKQGGTLRYLLSDHLGSTSVVLDASGNVVGRQKYYAYGRTRSVTGTIPTDKQYTGYQAEGELYFAQARFYDPWIGRFTAADTLVPEPGNPQALNRYSYVYNNPLGFVDPDGMCAYDPNGMSNLLGMCGGAPVTPPPPEPTPRETIQEPGDLLSNRELPALEGRVHLRGIGGALWYRGRQVRNVHGRLRVGTAACR